MIDPSPWPNFSFTELRCKCGKCNSTGHEMTRAFMDQVQKLRDLYGHPMALSSAYRCMRHPVEASKKVPGAHAMGVAVDIRCMGAEAVQILRLAMTLPFTGVGISQKGASRFIHLDMAPVGGHLPRPMIWSY
jgi:zinc D-Ala-D-Ala carboxypeptidase